MALLLMGGLLSQAATTAQMRFHCSGDTTTLDRLLLEGQQSGISQPEALVSFYAHKLLGTPYVAHTLEGDNEMLTINIDQLDCTTFVETLYALARTTLQGRQSWRDYAARLESVRIVHGKGTGALRKAVADHLKTIPYVKGYHAGAYGEGDLGVTIVTFK